MIHEDFSRTLPSRTLPDRTFGLVLAAILLAVGALPLLHRHPVRWWALAASLALFVTALAAPALLGPLNRAWARFSHVANTAASRVLAALLLVVAFAPTRLLLGLSGRDLLAMRWDPETDSYWIPRDPPGPDPASMSQQF